MDLEPEFDGPEFDGIVIGAGVGGIYQIKRLTDLGMHALLIEADEDLGGTWFRNRYPGARFDSESYTYGYSFSRELLDEWSWSERFSGQPENLRYLNFVADKFDLRQHMRFNSRVASMVFDEDGSFWTITLTDGTALTTRFVVCGLGLLSMPTPPRYEGTETFEGDSWHTYHWPTDPVDLSDKRVGVIGTGATGIQVIADIAAEVGHLTVFQRRPNWSAPLNNAPISEAEMNDIRSRYTEIYETCARTPGGFEHEPDRRGFWKVSPEERKALWDDLYDQPGFGIWLRNFAEIFTEKEANAEFSEYIAERIRQRVDDPAVAAKLIPVDHGFGMQRVPLETNYFEAYNRPNVELVDISETPIERITPAGVRTTAQDYDLDLIVYATGFDAITGAYDRIDIRGVDGVSLRDKWASGPVTYLGLFVHGFPNMFMIAGPQGASASSNFPRSIEQAVNWLSTLVQHVLDGGASRVEADADVEAQWTAHVTEMYSRFLIGRGKGWITGYNSNVEGREEGVIRYGVYNGGAPRYHARLATIADEGYPGISIR